MASEVDARAGRPLIRTKLHPPVRRALVQRPDLVRQMYSSEPRRLTLVRAPAGWGKSSLLSEWHAADLEHRPFAWLALDAADNDPARFWMYVIEALQTLRPDIGASSRPLLRAPGTTLVGDVLPELLNELSALTERAVLVLDDYHVIRSGQVHESLAFLIEHLPPTLELAVASRTEPPLPLARLRARGDLLEIDVVALRFSDREAAELFALHGLRLNREDVLRLTGRTEGWAAGLYLAALSLQSRTDTSAFVADFAGADRHVVDYLAAEVLSGLPADVNSFLTRTSILDRLCGPLCDAVLATEGSTRLLEEIERSNLFLVPLDRRREWYRYHHLFAELLRHELGLSEPDLIPTLHRRAAGWLLAAGMVSDGIHHTLAAPDFAEAGELISAHWNTFLNEGQVDTVDAWLSSLPAATISGDPRVSLARAGTCLTLGRNDEVDAWLDAAEAAAELHPAQVGASSVAAEAAIYRAVKRYRVGDSRRALEAARRAVELERGDRSPWRSMAYAALGRSLYWCGDVEGAEAALEEAIRLFDLPRNTLSAIGALGYLAVLHADHGEIEAALEQADAADRLSEESHFSEHWVTSMAHVGRGQAQARRGDLAAAAEAASRGLELARRGAGPVEQGCCLLALGDVRLRSGDRPAARKLLGEARAAVSACPDPGMLAELLETFTRRLRSTERSRGPAVLREELTERELAVLKLLGTRLSQREIGRELYVSLNTVKTHTKAVFRKLGVSSREEAVARARELGLVS